MASTFHPSMLSPKLFFISDDNLWWMKLTSEISRFLDFLSFFFLIEHKDSKIPYSIQSMKFVPDNARIHICLGMLKKQGGCSEPHK